MSKMAIILRGEEGGGGELDGNLADATAAGFDVIRCRSLLVSPYMCNEDSVCVCVCVYTYLSEWRGE